MLFVLLAACDKSPKPPAAPLSFGSSIWPGYEPFYLARELGYFPADKLHLAEYAKPAEAAKAFRSGALQIMAVTLDEALQLRRDIPDLKILLLLDASNGADAILAQSGIADLQQLKGRRVGVDNSVAASYLLSLALQGAGMQAGQLDIVHLPPDEMEAAFRAHKLDALVAAEPMRSRLLAAGAQPLFDSSRVPEKILHVLVTREEHMHRYYREMVGLVQGWQRALDYLRSEPGKAAQIMAKHAQMESARFGVALQGIELLGMKRNRALLLEEPPPIAASMESLQRFMMNNGMLQMGVDAAALLDTGMLAETRP